MQNTLLGSWRSLSKYQQLARAFTSQEHKEIQRPGAPHPTQNQNDDTTHKRNSEAPFTHSWRNSKGSEVILSRIGLHAWQLKRY